MSDLRPTSEQTGAVAKVLGFEEAQQPFSMSVLADEVGKGLPVTALERLAHAVAPDDRAFAFRLMPRATLARRKAEAGSGARLSPEVSARVARLAKIWALALDVWKTPESAREFMVQPHMLLKMRKPLDMVLENEFGALLVEDILGGLKYGTAV
jgi:putative toxin-antitoxin system antitoxin component (TIGR02293 family)